VGTLVFGSAVGQPASAAGAGTTSASAPPGAFVGAGTPAAPAVTDSPAPGGTAPSASPPPPASSPPTPKPTGDTAVEGAVLVLVNQERTKAGCQPLATDSRLATAARLHSQDMANRGYFDHTTPDGVTFDKRITDAGYRWSSVGENIAKGQKDAASVMRSWMSSPGHRANILNCTFKDIGIGLAYDSRRAPFWTQDFGTPLA
jgi:uncharacterized protein YkwD